MVSYILIAIVPGIVNVIVAGQKFNQQCKFLPFFKPYKSWGFWIWLVLQFTIPILIFWVIESLHSKPNIDFVLMSKAVGVGVGFVAIFNANVELGIFSLEIKSLYNLLVQIAYLSISNEQTRRTAAFWYELEQELNQSNANLTTGLDYLENYFTSDLSLHQEKQEQQEKLNKLKQIRSTTPQSEQIKKIKGLIMMNVRRNDLPEVLTNFSCSQQLINKYFS